MSTDQIRNAAKEACTRRYLTHKDPTLGSIVIRSLTELERMEIEFSKINEDGFDTAEAAKSTARLIVATIMNGQKELVFSEADIEWLSEMDARAAEPLKDAINAHVTCEASNSKAGESEAKKN